MRHRRGTSLSSAISLSFVLLSTVAWGQAAASEVEKSAVDEEGDEAQDDESEAQPEPDETEARLKELEAALAAQNAKIDEQNKRLDELAARAEAAEASAMAAEETATMALTTGGTEEEVDQPTINLYGFADMAFSKIYVDEGSRFDGFIDRDSSFAMGNVNLYVDANPSPNFRFLTEVRFTLFPHGDYDDNFNRIDQRTFDTTSATGRNRVILSNIVMERAWIEWKKYDAFKIRSGYFLTPYGIWNVDHGSPTLISSVLPTFWASEYFPTRQTGVQVLGEVFNDDWEYGYRAYVSNGRVDVFHMETDPFKLFGGRFYVKHTGDVDWQVGTSGFWNQEATIQKSGALTFPDDGSPPQFLVSRERLAQMEEYGVAGDVSVDAGDLRVRYEIVLNQQEFRDGFRTATSPGTFQRDQTRWNTYGIIAYQTPWFGLEPFTYIEYANRPTANDNSSWVLSGGVIEHLAPGTQFKFQAFWIHFPDDDTFPTASDADFPGWDMRLVTAF